MISAALHLVAAVLLLGGVIAWAGGLGSRAGTTAVTNTFRRSQWLIWTCLVILAVTGVAMLSRWHVTWTEITSGEILAARFGRLLALKVAGVAVMIAGFFILKPTHTLLWRLQLLAGLGVVFISILLVR